MDVQQIELGSNNDATIFVNDYGTLYNTVILVPMNITKNKSLSYKYRATLTTSQQSFKHDLHSLRVLKLRALDELKGDNTSNYLKYVDRMSEFKDRLGEKIFDFEISKGISALSIKKAVSKSDDEDNAHSNIQYLAKKKQEIIDGLTHLKIDPVWLEGQIKQALDMLEINLHFPHIPFPNGLALRNYNEDDAKDYIAGLLKKEEVTDKDKEILRRLTISENFIEHSYNQSLLVAEDGTLSLFKLILMFAHTTELINTALDKAGDLPLLGPYADTIKYKLIEKTTVAFVKIVKYASHNLKSPYNTVVPIAADVMTKILFKVMHITPQGSPYDVGTMKELAVKTAGKYILSSIPKIGFVPLTQKHVDMSMQLAKAGDCSSDYKTAQERVLEGSTSIMSGLSQKVGKTLETGKRDRELSGIATAISDLTALTSTIDPTSISKVLTIITRIASGGLLAHAIGDASVCYYRDIPEYNMNAVNMSYFPDTTFKSLENKYTLPMSSNRIIAGIASDTRNIINDYNDRLEKVRKAIEKGDSRKLQAIMTGFLEDEDKLSMALDMVESGIQNSDLRGKEAENVVNSIQKHELYQAQLFSEMITEDYVSSKKGDDREILSRLSRLVGLISNNCKDLSNMLNSLFSGSIQTPAMLSINLVSNIRELKVGESFEFRFRIRNIGSSTVNNGTFYVSSPDNIEFEKDSFSINWLATGEEDEFVIRGRVKSGSGTLSEVSYYTEGKNIPTAMNMTFIKIK